ncbi:hypothetical protein DFH27DRAFT_632142 [Peziza echinospora]|nr:hypothetical protein DFH27DRAFT_632142 [Peziza echinospora]
MIGLLVLTAIPTTVGVTQALRFQNQQKEQESDPVRFTLVCLCDESDELDRKVVVLHGGHLYLKTNKTTATYHPFSGYFLPYPHPPKPQGLVSTISVDPPMLNWVFVNSQTRQLSHGTGSESRPHQLESWGFEEENGDLQFAGDGEGWVAVEEEVEGGGEDVEGETRWALYHDGEEEGRKLDLEGRNWFPVEVLRVPIEEEGA